MGKYPKMFRTSQLMLVTKLDLLPHVPFRIEAFRRDVRAMREDLRILELSAVTGEGMEEWLAFLRGLVARSGGTGSCRSTGERM